MSLAVDPSCDLATLTRSTHFVEVVYLICRHVDAATRQPIDVYIVGLGLQFSISCQHFRSFDDLGPGYFINADFIGIVFICFIWSFLARNPLKLDSVSRNVFFTLLKIKLMNGMHEYAVGRQSFTSPVPLVHFCAA